MNVASAFNARERTVVAVDPGLATFGLVVVRTDGEHHRCIRAEVFTSSPDSRKREIEAADDMARRARDLSRFLDAELTYAMPAVVAAESMSFPRHHQAVVCISLSWGVLCDQLENRRLPLIHAGPREWRKAICGASDEVRAHKQALRVVPSFADRSRHIPKDMREHALDALGVFVWSLNTNMMRMALQAVAA